MVRPHDQVQLGHAPQQRGALLRRHAPGHDQLQAAHVLPLALRLRGTMQGLGWESKHMHVMVLRGPASACSSAANGSAAQPKLQNKHALGGSSNTPSALGPPRNQLFQVSQQKLLPAHMLLLALLCEV